MSKKYFLNFFKIALIVLTLFSVKASFAQTNPNLLNNDAIAVRVVPNTNHYSISRWYESQGFKGSPQTLTVDGYEAIRDGRTVYVNAAQISPETKSIFTNIYLISYNQDSNAKTVDVLGQLISHWEFNDNIISESQDSCAISSLSCDGNQDCLAGQTCSTYNKTCVLTEEKKCSVDSDCPEHFFCNSLKAKVIRDIKRIGILGELKEALASYNQSNKKYPILSAGTYLPNTSVSSWPSWNNSFLLGLSVKQKFVDPINRLGACPGYNRKTCWNEATKRFVYNPSSAYLTLPADSYAFVYSSNASGSSYNLCAVMESRDARYPSLSYHFYPNDPAGNECVLATGVLSGDDSANTPPKVKERFLKGESGRAFNGFVSVVDEQNDPLTWKLEPVTTNWTNWKAAAPLLESTNNSNNKKIFALQAGDPGTYQMKLTVSDNKGGTLTEMLLVTITNPAPFIGAEDINYLLDPTIPLDFSFFLSDNNIGDPIANIGPVYKLTKTQGPFDILAALAKMAIADGINVYKINYRGLISTANKFLEDTPFVYNIEATDKYGLKTNSGVTINVKVDKPILSFNCQSKIRVGKNFSCQLGEEKQGNHIINYLSSGEPGGLSILKSNNNFLLSGRVAAVTAANYNINIKAVNEYGTFTQKEFILKVNTYCGDGKKEEPNSELRGGFYNNGYEDCDGEDGITTNVSESSPAKQYLCTTKSETPEQIFGTNYCVFESPLKGGGFCGDGYCTLKQGEIMLENRQNCQKDCDPNCQPQCEGKVCGSDGCSGTCGPCSGVCSSDGQVCDDKPVCTPQCTNKECGPNSCPGDGVCGTCASGSTCNSSGKCVVDACTPQCTNKECGPNSCPGDGVCGTCASGSTCNSSGKCIAVKCVDNKACDDNKICTDDICNNPGTANSSCSYPGNAYTQKCSGKFGDCTVAGEEKCSSGVLGTCGAIDPRKASCSNKECGDDGCGGNCGVCSNGKICSAGKCITASCNNNSQCDDSNPCTDDSCQNAGTASATCQHTNNSFVDNTCVAAYGTCGFTGLRTCSNGQFGTCTSTNSNMTCGDLKCGLNPCGVDCGTCPNGKSCSAGACISNCMNGVYDEGEDCEKILLGNAATVQWRNGVTPTCSSATNGERPYGFLGCNPFVCKTDASLCRSNTICGNGIIEGDEKCEFDINSYVINPGVPAPAIYKTGYSSCAEINPSKPMGTISCSQTTCLIDSSNCVAEEIPECTSDANCRTECGPLNDSNNPVCEPYADSGERCVQYDGYCTCNNQRNALTAENCNNNGLNSETIDYNNFDSNRYLDSACFWTTTKLGYCEPSATCVNGSCVAPAIECINDSGCATGYYCQLNNSTFSSCNTSASVYTCQKKCWSSPETIASTLYRQGDITRGSSIIGCSSKIVDEPSCSVDDGCPLYCNDRRTPVGYTADDDTCKKGFPCVAFCRPTREVFKCEKIKYVKRYYQDDCRGKLGSTSLNGKIDAQGICIVPSSCGDGICDSQKEDCSSCSQDCGVCVGDCSDSADCPDGTCKGAIASCQGKCLNEQDRIGCEECGGVWKIDNYGKCIYFTSFEYNSYE